jgi:2'-hydroxyisoflavone reductase
VEAALARGHHVTMFNRGQHGAELFLAVEQLRGDREAGAAGLAALAGRRWDAVIDSIRGCNPGAICRSGSPNSTRVQQG